MWSDKESDSDYLNFGEVSQLIVDILTTPGMLPISVGVFGNWGSGKSSLLKFIDQQLTEQQVDYLPVRFDAWLYQGYDDARAALLETIACELHKAANDKEPLLKKTTNFLARVDMIRLLGFIGEGAAFAMGVPTGGLIARGVNSARQVFTGVQNTDPFIKDDYEEARKVVEEGKEAITGLIRKAETTTPPQQIDALRKEFAEILAELKKPLIVTIDNLDRCLPVNAIHTLEAIRLFLFLPNTAFVIAADEEMVQNAISEYFKGTSSRHQIDYLDKLIQIPIRVPKAGVREIRCYLFMLFAIEHGIEKESLDRLRTRLEDSLQQSWKDEPIKREEALNAANAAENENLTRAFELADRIAPILATSPIIHGNPRIVKRLLNVVKMRAKTAKRRKMALDESIITKLVIFERCAGAEATADLYHLIDIESGKPKALQLIENHKGDSLPKEDAVPPSWSKNATTSEFILKWSKLDPPLSDIDLKPAIYLSRETMPIGVYIAGLSTKGKEVLQALLKIPNITSPSGTKSVQSLPLEEQVPVMEGIIDQLRQIPDWNKKPDGFAGGCLLAGHSAEAAILLRRFINGLDDIPPWMNAMLKDMEWFKGV